MWPRDFLKMVLSFAAGWMVVAFLAVCIIRPAVYDWCPPPNATCFVVLPTVQNRTDAANLVAQCTADGSIQLDLANSRLQIARAATATAAAHNLIWHLIRLPVIIMFSFHVVVVCTLLIFVACMSAPSSVSTAPTRSLVAMPLEPRQPPTPVTTTLDGEIVQARDDAMDMGVHSSRDSSESGDYVLDAMEPLPTLSSNGHELEHVATFPLARDLMEYIRQYKPVKLSNHHDAWTSCNSGHADEASTYREPTMNAFSEGELVLVSGFESSAAVWKIADRYSEMLTNVFQDYYLVVYGLDEMTHANDAVLALAIPPSFDNAQEVLVAIQQMLAYLPPKHGFCVFRPRKGRSASVLDPTVTSAV